MIPVDDGKTSSARHPNVFAAAVTGGASGAHACLARCAVRVAGVDRDHAYAAPRRAQMFLVHYQRRGDHAV